MIKNLSARDLLHKLENENMSVDSELKAVKQIVKILTELNSEDAVMRVCDFVTSHLKEHYSFHKIILSDEKHETSTKEESKA